MIDELTKNHKDLLYDAAIIEVAGTIAEGIKTRPSSKLFQMSKAVQQVIFYVNDLRMERVAYDHFMQLRLKNELELKTKIQELETQLYSYEDNTIERRADYEIDSADQDAR